MNPMVMATIRVQGRVRPGWAKKGVRSPGTNKALKIRDQYLGWCYVPFDAPAQLSTPNSLMIGVRAEFCECDLCWSLALCHVVGMA